jgi:hypothetical protein
MQWLDKKEEDGQTERILEVGGAQVIQTYVCLMLRWSGTSVCPHIHASSNRTGRRALVLFWYVQVAKKDARAEKAQYKITVVCGVLTGPAAVQSAWL